MVNKFKTWFRKKKIGRVEKETSQDFAPTLEVHVKYKHDCESCKFLGRYVATNGNAYDLYFCKQEFLGFPTVIARYGDEGHSYLSGIDFADRSPAIKAAVSLARSKGYLTGGKNE
jgi:hypothetical protein